MIELLITLNYLSMILLKNSILAIGVHARNMNGGECECAS